MTIAIISHPDCAKHNPDPHHPERAARLSAIQDQLIASGLDDELEHHRAPQASREQLCRAHDAEFVDLIFNKSPRTGQILLDPDTPMTPHSLDAALAAAGAAILGVDLVMNNKVQAAFCNVRPPGHHAEHDLAMGFCIFNNIAVGVAHALSQYHLKRIAIVDFDVHHGNGTEDIFKNTPEVLLCSTFQHPFYPHSGADSTYNNIVNVPLAAGADGNAFRAAIEKQWLPELQDFKPELILFSAGFDAHKEDDMANLNLLEQDFAWVTHEVKKIAEQYAKGRMVSSLEGGYALSALGRSVAAHIKAMLG